MDLLFDRHGITLWLGDSVCSPHLWTHADVMITDPPYGMNYERFGHRDARILGDDSTSIRDAVISLWGLDKPALVFGTWKAARPENTRSVLVWDKTPGNGPGMGDIHASFGNSHEEIYVLGRLLRPPGVARRGSVISTSVGMSSLTKRIGHPTPKPDALMDALVQATQGVIADPFAGSGSTLCAALARGRSAVGVEIDPWYAQLAVDRLEDLSQQLHGERCAP